MGLTECWRQSVACIAAAVILAVALPLTAAQAQPITPAGGQLKCDVEGGLSYFVGSSRRLDCVYTPDGFPQEFYKGSINKIGIDIGFQRAGVIVWAVLSPGLANGPGSLTGNYVGVSADVAAGLGARSCSSRSASAAISASTSRPGSAISPSLMSVARCP
jgi:hypothetical protein